MVQWMSEWMPISTAPRDGTVILLAKAGKDAAPGRWFLGDPEFPWQTLEPRRYYDQDPLDGWRQDRPTHWMPLPPAPPAQEAPDALRARMAAGE